MHKLSIFGLFFTCFFCSLFCDDCPRPIVAVAYEQDASPKAILHLKNFPKNQNITMVLTRPLLEQEQEILNFSVTPENLLIFKDGSKHEVIECYSEDFLPGEEVSFQFSTIHGTFTKVSMFPHVVSKEDPNHAFSVSVELTSIEPTEYRLVLNGFHQNDLFLYTSQSEDEILTHLMKYNPSEGADAIHILPEVIGKAGGILNVGVFYKGVMLTVDVPWGANLKKLIQNNFKHPIKMDL